MTLPFTLVPRLRPLLDFWSLCMFAGNAFYEAILNLFRLKSKKLSSILGDFICQIVDWHIYFFHAKLITVTH